ncbi:hypothetical protein [Methylosinus sp. Sm6]|uniref:hypothetical protein n=1 Tax=Methylosinus sp. Sm6 TaxID=2866948 RepID=UPI001C999054|nr:hypothetical protein [Methylosinus sp. Sm6]MBY6240619.1 hypothetical protein [Methylosinus sp. Sm6]
MTDRKRPFRTPSRRSAMTPLAPRDAAASPPFARERKAVEAILRAEALSRAALEPPAPQAEAIDAREVDCAPARARDGMRERGR